MERVMQNNICNMRIASKECIDNMSLPNLIAYRKKAQTIRRAYYRSNKWISIDPVICDFDEIRPYTEQEIKDIKTLDWLKNYLKQTIKQRGEEDGV